MTLTLYLDAVGISAPGVPAFDALAEALGAAVPDPQPVIPASLSPRQAKRLSESIRIAIAAAEQIGPALPPEAAWIFATSLGEGETLHTILESLREDGMMVQPIRFQNSVHNAGVGQWTIAASLRGPSTSIAAFDETFGAGLLKAALQVTLERRAVGLVTYDAPLPEPLFEKRPISLPVAISLAFAPDRSPNTLARLRLVPRGAAPATKPATVYGAGLSASGNPAAAALPLLECLTQRAETTLVVSLPGGGACEVEVSFRNDR